MGREVRMVPADWEHPKSEDGRYIPLHDSGYESAAADWDKDCAEWCAGIRPGYAGDEARAMPNVPLAYALWAGDRPTPGQFMPNWADEERTHLQMYEDTSEGTPISPVMADPEALARWLADNNASSFGYSTATYDQWLATIKRGWAPSAMVTVGDDGVRVESGVEASE